jgi:hypothetical protein
VDAALLAGNRDVLDQDEVRLPIAPSTRYRICLDAVVTTWRRGYMVKVDPSADNPDTRSCCSC